MNRIRYLSALFINLLMPWLAYQAALPFWGQAGALVASATPLVAWMSWDFLRLRHFDALSAIVLAGILLSLAALTLGGGPGMRAFDSPLISGMIGLTFLVSLAFSRPLVFWLGRSTVARESHDGALRFDQRWREQPRLPAFIRLMTLVWGVGLTTENVLRLWIDLEWVPSQQATLASNLLRYGVYGALALWTIWCRRRLRQSRWQ